MEMIYSLQSIWHVKQIRNAGMSTESGGEQPKIIKINNKLYNKETERCP